MSSRTHFVEIDTHHCDACWECIAVCPTTVLGKVDIFFHRHVRIDQPEACNGCKRCVRACPQQAIRYIYSPPPRAERYPSGKPINHSTRGKPGV